MVRCPSQDLYVLNHLEYDADTLAEYLRDTNLARYGPASELFSGDDLARAPVNSCGLCLFADGKLAERFVSRYALRAGEFEG